MHPSPDWAGFTTGKRMAWFRPLAKALRAAFNHRDTVVLNDAELYSELDAVAAAVMREAASAQPVRNGQDEQAG
jgi:hypothetical protein